MLAFAARLAVFVVLMEGVSLSINVVQCFSLPIYWMLSYRLYRVYIRLTERLFGSLMVILTYLLCPVELVLYGDTSLLRNDQSLVVMSNHQTLVDWWYLWLVAWWKGAHGDVRIILKESLKWIPIVGWGMQFFEFIFLSRKIAIDEGRLRHAMSKIRTLTTPSTNLPRTTAAGATSSSTPTAPPARLPIWLLLFPEGTVYTPETIEVSTSHADKLRLPPSLRPRHTLLPRSRGLVLCLEELLRHPARSPGIDRLVDITMGFEDRQGTPGKGTPEDNAYDRFGLTEVFFGGKHPARVHLHVRGFDVADVPLDAKHGGPSATAEFFPSPVDDWLSRVFREKDDMMDGFYKTGRFPDDGKRVEVVKVVPRVEDVVAVGATVMVAWQVVRWAWVGVVAAVWGLF
ncbi:hypothetical protein HDU96_005782 [Phlyctochytrium bullatum]|nr:hypothetical protein HDU96_005782 [Phlyctochytrium bullatum]